MSTVWVSLLLTMQFANPADGTTPPVVEPVSPPAVVVQQQQLPAQTPQTPQAPTTAAIPAAPVTGGEVVQPQALSLADVPPLRSGAALRTAIRVALRKWSKVKPEDYGTAAREFFRLYEELQRDKGLPTIDRKNYATVVRSRLTRLTMQMKDELKKKGKLPQQPATIQAPGDGNAVLAQQMFGGGGGVNVQQGFGGMGAMGGGPPKGNDYGPELVELIQRTIQPIAWDVNGGPGHIHYWPQHRALIIAAPQDVHEQVGGVLEQLHRLGH